MTENGKQSQADKFKALAHEAECDDNEDNFDESLSRIARTKAPPVDKTGEKMGKTPKKKRKPAK